MKQHNLKQTGSSQGIKRQLCTLLALTSALALSACGGGASNTQNPNTNATVTTSNYTGPAPANADVQAFRVQLWENLRSSSHCGSCHDVGGQGSVAFANNSDVNAAYTAANPLVNLTDPASSRMVTKFSTGSGHFCWEATQSACAAELELWISNWAKDSLGSAGRTIQLIPPADTAPAPAMNFPSTTPSTYYTDGSVPSIYSLVTQHCSGCHVPNPTLSALPIAPEFAVGPGQQDLSYNTAIAVPLINLTNPTASRFYTRLAVDGHNCWTDCATAAQTMLNAINYFITGLPAPDLTELNSEVTSRAVTLLGDGIEASGGNRYEANQIALYEFKLGSGSTIIDRSGVSPSMNLTLTGVEGTDYEWLSNWGIQFDTKKAKAQASTSDSQKLKTMISSTGEYSIEAWVVPANVTQQDANIVSYSGGPMTRNFTLGQKVAEYEAYNRSTSAASDANGGTPLATSNSKLQATLQHVVLTYDPVNGRRFYVNGIDTGDADPDLTGSLTNWDSSFALVLGNEISLDRPWLGAIRMLAIHNRALTADQIKQNFDAGVGQKYFLMFNVSQHLGAECTSPDSKPYCFVVMEASQFDNSSYLFNAPRFVNLNDANVTPSNIHIKGIRIGINGAEASNGQAFANVDVCVNGSCAPTNAPYTTGTGAPLSSLGTVIAMQNGPASDEIFLTFEALGNDTPSKSYAENFPTTPTPLPTPPVVSDVMIHTFEEINASLAAMTGVPRTVAAINFDSSIDGSGSDGTYTQVIQGLPSSPNINGFVSAQQMAITQLAISYCDQLVEGNGTIPPGTYFSGLTFNGSSSPDLSFTSSTDRDAIITPLLAHVMNVDSSATDLTTMPNTTTVHDYLAALMAGGSVTVGGTNATVTGLNASCGGGNCGYTRTKTIIKATCAAAMAASPMLLQ